MKFNESGWLASRIRQWVEKGLISAEQADAILKTESDKTGPVKALTLLAALGAVCVAAGVVLVISYNWELIPRFFKIAGLMILLALLAETAVRLSDERRAFRTVCQILWLFLPLGGIGLYGQIYQLSGDVFKPLITWLVLTLPLIVLVQNTLVTFLHTAGLIAAIFAGTSDPGSVISLVAADPAWRRSGWSGTFGELVDNFGVALVLLPLLWTWAFLQAKRGLNDRSVAWVLLTCLIHVWILGAVHRTPFTVHFAPASFLLVSSLCALFWGGRQMLLPAATAGRSWGIALLSGIYYAMTYLWHVPSERFTVVNLAPVPRGALLALAAGGVLALLATMPRIFKLILLLPLLLSAALWTDVSTRVIAVIANAGLIGFALWLMCEGVRTANHKFINAGVALMGLLIVTRFIDYFGSLLRSGIAFIAVGLLFIGMAFALNMGRRRLIEMMRGGAA